MTRSAFGHLLCAPEQLDRRGRVDCLRRLQGRLAGAPDRESQWLAAALLRLLGGESDDLLSLLDLRPPRGSRQTVAAIVRQALRDVSVLRGEVACSAATVRRARQRRASPHGV